MDVVSWFVCDERRRVITGVGLLYLMLLTFLLQLKVEDARSLVHRLFPESGLPLPERSYASDCALYNWDTKTFDFTPLWKAVADEFIIAHLLGWYFSAMLIRDMRLCFVLSLAFELVEISFQHWLENFKVRPSVGRSTGWLLLWLLWFLDVHLLTCTDPVTCSYE